MSQDLSAADKVVVVMGPIGSGKSTFIKCATRQDGNTIGHKLRSFTQDIRTVRIEHPTIGSVVFVDTPGFDDIFKSDMEILTTIANWLVTVYEGKVPLAAIIYMHKISENRMTGSLLNNLNIFKSICGKKAMPNVVIATTMWGIVGGDEGEGREEELKGDFWKEILADGCKTARFDQTYESAWHIIGSILCSNPGTTLHIQEEMTNGRKPFHETTAGSHVKTKQDKESKGLWKKIFGFLRIK